MSVQRETRTGWLRVVLGKKKSGEAELVFDASDACVAPVLTFTEARVDAHARARDAFVDVAGVGQPAPAPRFSRTPGGVRSAPPARGTGGESALRDWGFSAAQIAALAASGVGFAIGRNRETS